MNVINFFVNIEVEIKIDLLQKAMQYFSFNPLKIDFLMKARGSNDTPGLSRGLSNLFFFQIRFEFSVRGQLRFLTE